MSLQFRSSGGLAYPDAQVVRSVAERCLKLYDASPQSAGSLHTQSRRFLDPHWKGLPGDVSDVPLRCLLERLASGRETLADWVSQTSPEVQSMFYWLSAFRSVGASAPCTADSVQLC